MGFLIPNLADVLDIFVVALILYSIMLLVRKSTGLELISSILIIFVLYFLASIYDLKMIMGILKGLQNYWILVLVIIFQSEIKNLISQLAKNKNLLSIFKNDIELNSDPIVEAVSIFSDTRTGALLVFEKSQNLDSHIASGQVIDGQTSTKLLLSIFNTATLLHDGAVVFRNNRLYAAKVVLPLSKNQDYGRTFGTRHLAAIGVTEVSDAFCIVVSEQTGRISFTKDKEIILDLSIEELRQKLKDETKKLKEDTKKNKDETKH